MTKMMMDMTTDDDDDGDEGWQLVMMMSMMMIMVVARAGSCKDCSATGARGAHSYLPERQRRMVTIITRFPIWSDEDVDDNHWCIVITTSIISKVKVTTSHVLVMSRNQRSNLYICYCASSNITLATEMAEISHLFWANCELAKCDQLCIL